MSMVSHMLGSEAQDEARIGPGRFEQSIEVAVFLFLLVPSLFLSLFAAHGQEHVGFVLLAVAIILRDLALVCLILFFVWRNREPLPRIGWTSWKWRKELALGILLFLPFLFISGLVEHGLEAAGFPIPPTHLPGFLTPSEGPELVLASFLVVVVAIAEETIFRGYLLLRLRTTMGSTVAAVVLSSLFFSVGHGYEGSVGVVTVGVMGVMLAIVYLWRGSLVAPVVMHFLQDFAGIVLLPLLTGKGH